MVESIAGYPKLGTERSPSLQEIASGNIWSYPKIPSTRRELARKLTSRSIRSGDNEPAARLFAARAMLFYRSADERSEKLFHEKAGLGMLADDG